MWRIIVLLVCVIIAMIAIKNVEIVPKGGQKPFTCNFEFIEAPRNKATISEPKTEIVVHSTANFNAYADAHWHAEYLDTARREASWHFSVDSQGIVQHYPTDVTVWHVGKPHNSHTIAIEMCEGTKAQMEQTIMNTDALIAELWKHYGKIPVETHNHVTGKNCPGKAYQELELYKICSAVWQDTTDKDTRPALLNPVRIKHLKTLKIHVDE